MPDEPQSYGSQNDWVTGKTGETVNQQKSEPPPQHKEFYDGSLKSETVAAPETDPASHPTVEAVQSPAAGADEELPMKKVSDQRTGAKRDSYFKKRDYGP